jgi:chorismate mutase / prephenate dehydratase
MTIEDWRVEIDSIDGELLRLLNARARLAVRVGESKRVAGLSVCDRGREREVIERACRANQGPLDSQAVARIFRQIIRESRRVQTEAAADAGAQAEGAGR